MTVVLPSFEWCTGLLNCSPLVNQDVSANLWMRPNVDSFWCGTDDATVCQNQSGARASLIPYPGGGSILGLASVSSTQTNTMTAGIDTLFTGITSPASRGISASAIATPSQPPQRTVRTATAIGACIDVPLGIAVVGLIGSIFWKESRRRGMERPTKLKPGNKSSESAINQDSHGGGESRELADAQVPWELDHRVMRAELPNTQQVAR